MKSKQRMPRDGTRGAGRRKQRPRPMPKWLQSSAGLDAIARARCQMLLAVLSGEKPVSEAILEAKISRASYYQMETRALKAMLGALKPLAPSSRAATAPLSAAAAARIEQLQARIKRLEQEKRRSERLLLLARKCFRVPLSMPRRGRPAKAAPLVLIPNGTVRLKPSRAKAVLSVPSTPTRAGENAP